MAIFPRMPNIMPPRSARARSRRRSPTSRTGSAARMVIDPTTLSGDKVVFGATVHLLDEDDKPVNYQIVGQTEADAKVGRISLQFAARPRADRPQGRRRGRGVGAVGRPLLRDREDRVHLNWAAGQHASARKLETSPRLTLAIAAVTAPAWADRDGARLRASASRSGAASFPRACRRLPATLGVAPSG